LQLENVSLSKYKKKSSGHAPRSWQIGDL